MGFRGLCGGGGGLFYIVLICFLVYKIVLHCYLVYKIMRGGHTAKKNLNGLTSHHLLNMPALTLNVSAEY